MNPFEAAAAADQQLRCDGGGPPPQHPPHGRLLASSSSGDADLSSDQSGDAAGGHGGHLSPSVSAMATVSIRSNSGPPAPVAGAAWSCHGKGGSFLVPGYALPNGRSTASPSVGMASPATPIEGGQRTAAVLLPERTVVQSPSDEGSVRLAATAATDGPTPMDVGPAADAPVAESDEAVALETLAAMGRAASAFGSQGSAFRAVPPRRTFSGPVTLREQPAHPARQQSHLAGPNLKMSTDEDAGTAAERRPLAVTFGKKLATQRVLSPDGSPSFSAQHEPTGSSRSSGDNGNNGGAALKRERPRQLPPLPEDSAGRGSGGSAAATGTGYTASRASYRKRSVTSPASGGLPAEFEAARQGLAPPVKRNRPGVRALTPAMSAPPIPPQQQAPGAAAQSGSPATGDEAGMTPATHARMAAYAAMVYNANRPAGYPALAVVPDCASALAEQINSVVACTSTNISPPSEATLATANKFHKFMASNSPQLSAQPVARSPPPKPERTVRRASTPATLAAAAASAALSAPPLANGQAVFGAGAQAMLGRGSLDGSMTQQQGTALGMTPEMATALQEFLLQRGGFGMLESPADAAVSASMSALANGGHAVGANLTMPTASAPSGMAPQLLADGVRVRSNSLGPFSRSSQQQQHPRAQQTRAPPPPPAPSPPSHNATPATWTGPFLSGPSSSSMLSAGVAAAVTEAMAANGVTSMLDGATAKAFLAALASQAGGNGGSEGHRFAAAPHMTLS